MGHADRSRELATLLQLLHRAREADGAARLGFVMVNETQHLLPYRQAAFWREGLRAHVAALSGLAEPDPTAPYLQCCPPCSAIWRKDAPTRSALVATHRTCPSSWLKSGRIGCLSMDCG